jgi:hypothetical protein
LPPGTNVEKVHAGIAVAVKQFAERGWEADLGFIRPDETAGPTLERQLASKSWKILSTSGKVAKFRLGELKRRVTSASRRVRASIVYEKG